MQGLGDVTEEMDKKLQGFGLVGGGERGVLDAGSVVGDGADDAACFAAVASEGDGAGGWRGVFCVDEAGEVG